MSSNDLTFLLKVAPVKTPQKKAEIPSKTRVIWVLGMYAMKSCKCVYIYIHNPETNITFFLRKHLMNASVKKFSAKMSPVVVSVLLSSSHLCPFGFHSNLGPLGGMRFEVRQGTLDAEFLQ